MLYASPSTGNRATSFGKRYMRACVSRNPCSKGAAWWRSICRRAGGAPQNGSLRRLVLVEYSLVRVNFSLAYELNANRNGTRTWYKIPTRTRTHTPSSHSNSAGPVRAPPCYLLARGSHAVIAPGILILRGIARISACGRVVALGLWCPKEAFAARRRCCCR